MVAAGQDVDLHHVVLQLLLRLGVDNFGSSEDAGLLVLGLQGEKGVQMSTGGVVSRLVSLSI